MLPLNLKRAIDRQHLFHPWFLLILVAKTLQQLAYLALTLNISIVCYIFCLFSTQEIIRLTLIWTMKTQFYWIYFIWITHALQLLTMSYSLLGEFFPKIEIFGIPMNTLEENAQSKLLRKSANISENCVLAHYVVMEISYRLCCTFFCISFRSFELVRLTI